MNSVSILMILHISLGPIKATLGVNNFFGNFWIFAIDKYHFLFPEVEACRFGTSRGSLIQKVHTCEEVEYRLVPDIIWLILL